MGRFIDMTGWVMAEHGVPDSRLTVIKRVGTSDDGKAMWLCECSCVEHNHIIVSGYNLRRQDGKATRSCGCLRKEVAASNVLNVQHLAAKAASISNKEYNDVRLNLEDEYGLYGVGFCHNTGKEFYFDMDDYDKIKNICWNEQFKNIPVLQGRDLKTNKMVRMHSYLGYNNYDHIDRNELNNRKHNLRPATKQENARNHSLLKNNKSGFTGVYWDKKSCQWRAYITIDRKHIYLGLFIDKKDAIVARLYAEKKYFGEFAPQRHLFKQYGIFEGGDKN